ncbi:hypothetical protein MHYP_G00334310 [Metynnis hypsauchen]
MEEAYERKHLRYSELAAEARHQGWNTEVRPVEVGCRGFVGKSATKLLRDMGIRGQSLRTAIKAASEAAERSSQWLWLKRNDPSWAPRFLESEFSGLDLCLIKPDPEDSTGALLERLSRCHLSTFRVLS